MKGLVLRTREFSSTVLRFRRSLPDRRDVWVIQDQLTRAGLSPGAHFRESLHARAHREYVAKLSGGLMELEETLYWLELLVEDGVVAPDDAYVEWLGDEGRQLIARFTALINKHK